MSDDHRPFIDRVIQGEVLELSSIDDDIDAWHKQKPGVPIHQWLGMTEDEYALWVERPNALPFIAQAHKYGTEVSELLQDDEPTSIAARGASLEETRELVEWLRKTGRI